MNDFPSLFARRPGHGPTLAWITALLMALALRCRAAETVALPLADQSNVMEAQIQLLRKRQELHQALAQQLAPGQGVLPRILAIYGTPPALMARLALPGGIVASVRAGDRIRDGLQVAQIEPREVSLELGSGRQRRRVSLEFATAATGLPGTQVAPGMPMGAPAAPGPVPAELLPPPPAIAIDALRAARPAGAAP